MHTQTVYLVQEGGLHGGATKNLKSGLAFGSEYSDKHKDLGLLVDRCDKLQAQKLCENVSEINSLETTYVCISNMIENRPKYFNSKHWAKLAA